LVHWEIISCRVLFSSLAYHPKLKSLRYLYPPRHSYSLHSEPVSSKMIKDRNFYSKNYNPSGDFANEFVDNGDGTVTDRVTGLMWQKEGSPSEVTFEGASDYAKALNAERFGGYTNWRLPTIEELCSLLEPIQNKKGQHIDPVFAGNIYASWSCDRFVDVGIPRGLVVSFTRGDVVISSGSVSGLLRYERQFVRAVRTMK